MQSQMISKNKRNSAGSNSHHQSFKNKYRSHKFQSNKFRSQMSNPHERNQKNLVNSLFSNESNKNQNKRSMSNQINHYKTNQRFVNNSRHFGNKYSKNKLQKMKTGGEYSIKFEQPNKLVQSNYSGKNANVMPVIGHRSKSLNTQYQNQLHKMSSKNQGMNKINQFQQNKMKKNLYNPSKRNINKNQFNPRQHLLNSSGSLNEKISKNSTGSQPFSMGRFKMSGFLSPKNDSLREKNLQNNQFALGSQKQVKMNFTKKKNMINSKYYVNKPNAQGSNGNISVQMKFVNVNGLENGKEKVGQDSVLINKFKIQNEIFYVFGVFDGHGRHGHYVSQYAKKNMIPAIKYFLKKQFETGRIKIKEVLRNACHYINMKITKISNSFTKKWGGHREMGNSGIDGSISSFDASLSGTTCSLVLLFKNQIFSLSLGDSKAVLGMLHPGESSFRLMPYIISTEHKASSKSEQNRILASGGLLHPIMNKHGEEVGPIRIWDSGNKYPGLMVARSFGDLVGKSCGVSGEPDIMDVNLTPSHRCLVVASDGFWDMHSNLEALTGFYSKKNRNMEDIEKVLVNITKRTLERWEKNFGGVHRDDISIVLVYFNHE
jgi:serine/threonine protein phosphatase PrpC